MGMRWYVVRRVAWAVLATYLVLSLTFGLLTVSPNAGEVDAAMQAAASGQNPEEARELYRQRRGLDRPLWDRYVDYVVNMATLNWGWSESQVRPVAAAIANHWAYSAQFVIPATAIAVLSGYAIGLYTALRQHTWVDRAGTIVAFVGVSIPNFWLAIMLILFGGVWLQDALSDVTVLGVELSGLAFPTFYDPSVALVSLANAHQLVLPTVVVATALLASQTRYARAQALEYVDAEFVKVARAKGAGEWRILVRHVLRVAIVPLLTILVADLVALLWAQAVLTEYVFQIPGVGLLSFEAIRRGDTALVMATTLIPVVLAIVGNLLQDLAYVYLDPRIDYGDR